ncbi:MAG: hypothetical protein E4H08_01115 [Candidatus Atribacteria bacterium]|nr:MAG: hypothetical protein E4H08_01115 [Candidatus Atribacteria bacterium]
MQFLVLGYDGSDEKAFERRMAVREQHLAGSQRMYAAGRWQDSGALLDDAGTMIGSFIVCDYPSREELEIQWLNQEPYVTGKVWERIQIHPIQLSPRACSVRNGSVETQES